MAALPQVLFVPGREMTLKQAQIKAKNLDKSLGGSIACCRVLPKAKKGPRVWRRKGGTDSGASASAPDASSYRVVVSGCEDREKTAREIKSSIGVDIGASVPVVGLRWLRRPTMPPAASDLIPSSSSSSSSASSPGGKKRPRTDGGVGSGSGSGAAGGIVWYDSAGAGSPVDGCGWSVWGPGENTGESVRLLSFNTNGSKQWGKTETQKAASACFRRFLPDVLMLQETWIRPDATASGTSSGGGKAPRSAARGGADDDDSDNDDNNWESSMESVSRVVCSLLEDAHGAGGGARGAAGGEGERDGCVGTGAGGRGACTVRNEEDSGATKRKYFACFNNHGSQAKSGTAIFTWIRPST